MSTRDTIQSVFKTEISDLKKLRKIVFSFPRENFQTLLSSETIYAVEIAQIYFELLWEMYEKDKSINNKVSKKEILENHMRYFSDLRFPETVILKAFWKVAERNPYDFELDHFVKPGTPRLDVRLELAEASRAFRRELNALLRSLGMLETT